MTNSLAANPKLESLRKQVRVAAAEFDMAVMFYEVWRTGMEDTALHDRLGVSYATNAFRIVVTALRRELLMSLTRMWDKPKSTLRMDMIANAIRDPNTIALLAEESGTRIEKNMMRTGDTPSQASVGAIISVVKTELDAKAAEAVAIADKYSKGGVGFALLDKLRNVRHERLAHYALEAVAAPEKGATDQEIEDFYRDNSDLVRILLSLVTATAYDPQQGAAVQRTYAKLFWASVKGENTEGHPNFRTPL